MDSRDFKDLPPMIRLDLFATGDEGFIRQRASEYRQGDDDTKADILRFHSYGEEAEGVRQMQLKHEDGTPTASELKTWR